MEAIEFLVQGSAEKPYRVSFNRKGANISAHCTCPAGENGQYCKHRFGIMAGDTTAVVSGNLAEVEKVAAWIPGSDIDRAIQYVRDAEKSFEAAKRILSSAKRALAQAMRD